MVTSQLTQSRAKNSHFSAPIKLALLIIAPIHFGYGIEAWLTNDLSPVGSAPRTAEDGQLFHPNLYLAHGRRGLTKRGSCPVPLVLG